MQKHMELLMEELREAKQSWAVGDENPKRQQQHLTASMLDKATAEGQSEFFSSISRCDHDSPPLKSCEDYEEFSEDMNEYSKPVLTVFPKTKNKKLPPEITRQHLEGRALCLSKRQSIDHSQKRATGSNFYLKTHRARMGSIGGGKACSSLEAHEGKSCHKKEEISAQPLQVLDN